MAEICLGTDREGWVERPAVLTVINSNSPLRLDGPMAPVIVAGATVQQHGSMNAGILSTVIIKASVPLRRRPGDGPDNLPCLVRSIRVRVF